MASCTRRAARARARCRCMHERRNAHVHRCEQATLEQRARTRAASAVHACARTVFVSAASDTSPTSHAPAAAAMRVLSAAATAALVASAPPATPARRVMQGLRSSAASAARRSSPLSGWRRSRRRSCPCGCAPQRGRARRRAPTAHARGRSRTAMCGARPPIAPAAPLSGAAGSAACLPHPPACAPRGAHARACGPASGAPCEVCVHMRPAGRTCEPPVPKSMARGFTVRAVVSCRVLGAMRRWAAARPAWHSRTLY